MRRRKAVDEIYSSSAASDRYYQVETDLRKFASEDLDFDFNPNGTQLFSLMELCQSYARRCVDFVDTVHLLLESEKPIPSAVVGRSLIETIAMGCLFLSEMRDCIATSNRARLELKLARFFAGVSGAEVKPVHVMDAIRHLQKVDAEYVAYLNRRFGTFTLFDAARKIVANGKEVLSHSDVLSMQRTYDQLSEIAHPNGTGVQYLYPDPRNEDGRVEGMRKYYRHVAVSSTWQCMHLLKELELTRDLPSQYVAAFGLPT